MAAKYFARSEIRRVGGITIKVNQDSANLIRQDSVAEVGSPTLIGSEYVEISPGTSGYPRIEPHGDIASRERKSVTEHLADLASEENIQKVKVMLVHLAQFTTRNTISREQKLGVNLHS